MNPLKEYAHLFANGKFGVEWAETKRFKLIGFSNIEPELQIQPIDDPIHYEWTFAKSCTLIARPIEDMTNEECTGSILFECLKDKAEPKYIRHELIRMNSLTRTIRLSLYLLSMGVYPFDQSHFEDGTVININEI